VHGVGSNLPTASLEYLRDDSCRDHNSQCEQERGQQRITNKPPSDSKLGFHASIIDMGATSLHFSDHELACHHCGVNGCQPMLVAALEQLRALICSQSGRDVPLYIDDAYRCSVWNSKTPNAATHSQHVLGEAADVRAPGFSAWNLWMLAKQIPEFKGIGRADIQGYLHVDVREVPARWCYNQQGAVIPWFDLKQATAT
jgi:hypothetical protein